MYKSHIWKNKSGWCILIYSDAGIVNFSFGFRTRQEAAKTFINTGEYTAKISQETDIIRQIVSDLDGYFGGAPVEFKIPLDFPKASEFQKRVWAAASQISYGSTRSYAELAKAMGAPHAARAVGNALGANPAPVIIPCHRVLLSDGSLGGFAIGSDVKQALLFLEQGKSVDFNKVFFER